MTLLWSVTTPLCDSCFRALYKSCFICWFQFLILARRSNRQFHLLILPSYNVLCGRNIQGVTPFHQMFNEKVWVLVYSRSLYEFARNIQGLTPFHQKVPVLVCSWSVVRGPETYKDMHFFTKGAKKCQKWLGVSPCMFLIGIYKEQECPWTHTFSEYFRILLFLKVRNIQELTLFQDIFGFLTFSEFTTFQ